MTLKISQILLDSCILRYSAKMTNWRSNLKHLHSHKWIFTKVERNKRKSAIRTAHAARSWNTKRMEIDDSDRTFTNSMVRYKLRLAIALALFLVSHLGLFHGGDDLYTNPWEGTPAWLKSRLWSCSISCERRSLKKSSRVVSSTRVEDATNGCLRYPIPY